MSAHHLLNQSNELRKAIKCKACNEFNKFKNTGARMLDSLLLYEVHIIL